jgi:hypothetical protein
VKTKLVKKKEIQIDYFLFVHRKVTIHGVDVTIDIDMSQTEIFFANSGLLNFSFCPKAGVIDISSVRRKDQLVLLSVF